MRHLAIVVGLALHACSVSLDLNGPTVKPTLVAPDADALLDDPDAGLDAGVEQDPDAELEPADAAPDSAPDATPDAGCFPVIESCNGADDDCDGLVDEVGGLNNRIYGRLDECCAFEDPPFHIGMGDAPLPIGSPIEVGANSLQICVSGNTRVDGHLSCTGEEPGEVQGQEWGRLALVSRDGESINMVRTIDCNADEESCELCPFQGCVTVGEGSWQLVFSHGGGGQGRQSFDLTIVQVDLECAVEGE